MPMDGSASGENAGKFAMGAEFPIRQGIQLTGDLFKSTLSDTGLQLGLRWEVQKGLKLSAAAGRIDNENTLFADFSWEF